MRLVEREVLVAARKRTSQHEVAGKVITCT
jgi:hypothetical protein